MNWYLIKVAQTVSQYVKQKNLQWMKSEIAKHPQVAEMIHSLERPIGDFSPGKQGTLLLGGNNHFRIPVQVLKYDPTLPNANKNGNELMVQLARTDGKDWSEIYHMAPIMADRPTNRILELMKDRAIIVDESSGQRILNWLTYVCSQAPNPKQILNELLFDGRESIWQMIQNGGGNFNSLEFTLEAFKAKKQEVDNQRQRDENAGKAYRGQKGPDGVTVMEFPNGWKWVDLQCGYSRAEGDAGYHCGNVGAIPGDTILSLRDNDNKVHITLVHNGGRSGEIKAPGNKKPRPYTFPYLVDLFKKGIIDSLGHPTYLPEQNFHISDLPSSMIKELQDAGFQPAMNAQSKSTESPEKEFFEQAFDAAKGDLANFNRIIRRRFGKNFPLVEYNRENKSLITDKGISFVNLAELYGIRNATLPNWRGRALYEVSRKATENPDSPFTQYLRRYIKPYFDTVKDYSFEDMRNIATRDANFKWGITEVWQEACLEAFVRDQNEAFRTHLDDENGFFPQLYIEDKGSYVGRRLMARWEIKESWVNPEDFAQLRPNPSPNQGYQLFHTEEAIDPSIDDLTNALRIVDFANRRKYTPNGSTWLNTRTQK